MSHTDRNGLIALSHGDYELEISPRLGGSATAMRWRGRDVLRPNQSAEHAIDTASFVMAPFANRVAHGRFSFGGREVKLKRVRPGDTHPLHGSAWISPWRAESASASRLELSSKPKRSDWPWPLLCRQVIEIDEAGVRFELSVRNVAKTPMPMSFGFHPYFLRPPGAVLRANVRGVWRTSADLLPVRCDPVTDLPGLGAGAPLDAAPFIDHCHTGWDGEVVLSSPDMTVRMTASPEFGYLHLYLPRGETFFCAEPVSAIPDAFNRADPTSVGLLVLAPGQSASGWMRIAAG